MNEERERYQIEQYRLTIFYKKYHPMPQTDGGADFGLVEMGDMDKPSCNLHGAMNKVSEVFWRCVTTNSSNNAPCRAGCMEDEV